MSNDTALSSKYQHFELRDVAAARVTGVIHLTIDGGNKAVDGSGEVPLAGVPRGLRRLGERGRRNEDASSAAKKKKNGDRSAQVTGNFHRRSLKDGEGWLQNYNEARSGQYSQPRSLG